MSIRTGRIGAAVAALGSMAAKAAFLAVEHMAGKLGRIVEYHVAVHRAHGQRLVIVDIDEEVLHAVERIDRVGEPPQPAIGLPLLGAAVCQNAIEVQMRST